MGNSVKGNGEHDVIFRGKERKSAVTQSNWSLKRENDTKDDVSYISLACVSSFF